MVAKDYKKVFDDTALKTAQNQSMIDRAQRGVKGIEDIGWQKGSNTLSINTGVEDAGYNERKYTSLKSLPERHYDDKHRLGKQRLRKRRLT